MYYTMISNHDKEYVTLEITVPLSDLTVVASVELQQDDEPEPYLEIDIDSVEFNNLPFATVNKWEIDYSLDECRLCECVNNDIGGYIGFKQQLREIKI